MSCVAGQELGTLVKQVTANDKDLNPVLRYDFTPDGNPGRAFSIDRYSGRITVVRQLDYEQRARYRLRVKATDGTFNATTNVTVQIVDQNDNAPQFAQLSYQVTLAELTEANQPVVTVNATDRDAGENARLTYSIFSARPFRIDPLTGEYPPQGQPAASADITLSCARNQWPTTGPLKAVVCAVLSVGKCI